MEDFEKGKFFIKPLDFPVVISAVRDSAESNIHIYDYLVAYPLKEVVTRIYSADSHFMHPHFQSIAEVKNPISPWIITEGKTQRKLPNNAYMGICLALPLFYLKPLNGEKLTITFVITLL